jgi:hypothetical protein
LTQTVIRGSRGGKYDENAVSEQALLAAVNRSGRRLVGHRQTANPWRAAAHQIEVAQSRCHNKR